MNGQQPTHIAQAASQSPLSQSERQSGAHSAPIHTSTTTTSSTTPSSPSLDTPNTPSTPPTSFVPLGRVPSIGHSPTRSPQLFATRRKSSASSPLLKRRASEHFESRVDALKNDPEGKAEVAEVNIRMPKEDIFIENIAILDAQASDSPHSSRSQSPLCPTPPSPPRPTPHHISSIEPPKLQHGHSGLCSPPTTSNVGVGLSPA